ncbi:hypothetical protein CAEBREN_24824 [Caenorhabditis brenneri]|uniref:EB domain-containing protein n=1 Tax=Caenorhabditis brenneri TaxID=135651 RepID=G0NDC9_CAEBE|nr:hypothetical protein CAEBREN_24824 [Caenorhabditis brenneri]
MKISLVLLFLAVNTAHGRFSCDDDSDCLGDNETCQLGICDTEDEIEKSYGRVPCITAKDCLEEVCHNGFCMEEYVCTYAGDKSCKCNNNDDCFGLTPRLCFEGSCWTEEWRGEVKDPIDDSDENYDDDDDSSENSKKKFHSENLQKVHRSQLVPNKQRLTGCTNESCPNGQICLFGRCYTKKPRKLQNSS